MKVALNGHDFTEENDFTLFTFVGTATLFSYWPYIIGFLLALLALIALIMFCSAWVEEVRPEPEEQEVEKAGRPGEVSEQKKRGPASGLRPHTLRDEFGFYRTRGFFAEKQPGAPGSPVVGGSVYRPSEAPGRGSTLLKGFPSPRPSPRPTQI